MSLSASFLFFFKIAWKVSKKIKDSALNIYFIWQPFCLNLSNLLLHSSISITKKKSQGFPRKIIGLHNLGCLLKIWETQNTFQSGIGKYWILENTFRKFHDETLPKTAHESLCRWVWRKISISAFSWTHFATNPFICFHLRTKITASKFLPRCHSWKEWRVKINTSKQRIFLGTASSGVSTAEMLWREKNPTWKGSTFLPAEYLSKLFLCLLAKSLAYWLFSRFAVPGVPHFPSSPKKFN